MHCQSRSNPSIDWNNLQTRGERQSSPLLYIKPIALSKNRCLGFYLEPDCIGSITSQVKRIITYLFAIGQRWDVKYDKCRQQYRFTFSCAREATEMTKMACWHHSDPRNLISHSPTRFWLPVEPQPKWKGHWSRDDGLKVLHPGTNHSHDELHYPNYFLDDQAFERD